MNEGEMSHSPEAADGDSSRAIVWNHFIAFIGLVAIGAASSKVALTQMVTHSLRPVAAQEGKRVEALQGHAGSWTEELMTGVIRGLGATEDASKIVAPSLLALFKTGVVSKSAVVDLLRAAGIEEEKLVRAADALIVLVFRAEGEGGSLADSFLTSLSASASADRALVSTTLAEVAFERAGIQFVTAIAASNAESDNGTGSPVETPAEHRTRSAEMLLLLQEGGNAVVRATVGIDNKAPARLSVVLDAGVLGDWANLGPRSRYVFGGVLEGSVLLKATRGGTSTDRPSLFLGTRAGVRWSRLGVLTNLDRENLSFAQFLAEFRLPSGAVPIGISVNIVPSAVREFARPVHVYVSVAP